MTILIYQMGKVGSTTLESSLPKSRHLHTLYGYPSARNAVDYKRRNLLKDLRRYVFWLVQRMLIRQSSDIRIVTLVRNPFDREVSQFFQDLEHWLSYYSLKFQVDKRLEIGNFVECCFEYAYDFNYSVEWYWREIGRFSGLGLEEYKYDLDKGYAFAERGKYKVMLVRLDKLEECKLELESFLGQKLKLTNTNRGEKKWYEPIYRRFKSDYVPSESVIEKIFFEKNWVRCMYSKSEWSEMKEATLENREHLGEK